MKRWFLTSACLLAALSLSAPVLSAEPAKPSINEDMKVEHVTQNVGSVTIDWSEGVVRVTGSGSPPDRGNPSQKRMMAERTATADAYRQLNDAIQGIRVNSETIVRDYVSESDTIKNYVSALVKGAQKIDQRYLNDGTIEIDMAVKLYSNTGLSGVLQPQKHVVPPPAVDLEPMTPTGEYTGIIVDCRGLELQPAMSPAIVSAAGGELYLGGLEVTPEVVINQGVVGYARSLQQARQDKRVGSNPLIVKGTSSTGNFHTDVVISDIDTKQLLGVDLKHKLLKEAKVIFVM